VGPREKMQAGGWAHDTVDLCWLRSNTKVVHQGFRVKGIEFALHREPRFQGCRVRPAQRHRRVYCM
jgi:hypothetical protein